MVSTLATNGENIIGLQKRLMGRQDPHWLMSTRCERTKGFKTPIIFRCNRPFFGQTCQVECFPNPLDLFHVFLGQEPTENVRKGEANFLKKGDDWKDLVYHN